MSDLFKTIKAIHARAALVLVTGAVGFLGGHPAAARGADLGRYEAMVGAPAPQIGAPAWDCGRHVAFGTGDDQCGSLSGGPSGGNSTRN